MPTRVSLAAILSGLGLLLLTGCPPWWPPQYDQSLTDFSYSVGDRGATFRFRDTLKRYREDSWGVGLFDVFEAAGGPLLTWAHAAPVDTEGNYEAFFSWEMLGQDPSGPPYEANTWSVVESNGHGGVASISYDLRLEPNWLPDVVNRNLTDFTCGTSEEDIALRFRDAGHAPMDYSVRVLDHQGLALATVAAAATNDGRNYEAMLRVLSPSPQEPSYSYTGTGIPAREVSHVASWVIVGDLYGQEHVVSEPQPAAPACFFDPWQPALWSFSYRVEEDTIYFSFRDTNFARAGKRPFEVLLGWYDDVHYGGNATAKLIDDAGNYQATFPRDAAYLNHVDAWRVSEDVGDGTSRNSALQPLDRESLAPPTTP